MEFIKLIWIECLFRAETACISTRHLHLTSDIICSAVSITWYGIKRNQQRNETVWYCADPFCIPAQNGRTLLLTLRTVVTKFNYFAEWKNNSTKTSNQNVEKCYVKAPKMEIINMFMSAWKMENTAETSEHIICAWNVESKHNNYKTTWSKLVTSEITGRTFTQRSCIGWSNSNKDGRIEMCKLTWRAHVKGMGNRIKVTMRKKMNIKNKEKAMKNKQWLKREM
jgi:hypothetical protein